MQENKLNFTFGDKVRRRHGDRRVHTVKDIGERAYYFSDGTFALIADQDCYETVEKASGFFLVDKNYYRAPLDEHLQHGYEDRDMFVDALRKLTRRYGGRTGENIDNRNGFLKLRFYDNAGGGTEDAWLPLYLLTPTEMPAYLEPVTPSEDDEIIRELDEAFGFD